MNLSEETITAAETLVKHHNDTTPDDSKEFTTFYKDGAFILVATGETAREFQALMMVQELLEGLKQTGLALDHGAFQKIADEVKN